MIFHRKKKKKRKQMPSLLEQLPKAIVYLSDVFVFLIVLTWIFYIINGVIGAWYELVNIHSTTIFSDLKEACTIPLTAGGGLWLIRTAINHYHAGQKGHRLSFDFPNIDDDGNVVDNYVDSDINAENQGEVSDEETPRKPMPEEITEILRYANEICKSGAKSESETEDGASNETDE